MLLQCPVVLSVPAAAGLGLSLLSPVPHPGDCPGQPQLLARSHARGAAVLQHPRQAQTRALLAARHILGTTSHQELGAHLLGVLPSPPCVPKAPGGVSPPPILEQKLCPGQGGSPAASGRGTQVIFCRLQPPLTCWSRVCCALWTAPLSFGRHRPSCYLVPKSPVGHPSPTALIATFWAPSRPGTAVGFGALPSHTWPGPWGHGSGNPDTRGLCWPVSGCGVKPAGRAGAGEPRVPWVVGWGWQVARAVTSRTMLSRVRETHFHRNLLCKGQPVATISPYGQHHLGPTAATCRHLGCLSAMGLNLLTCSPHPQPLLSHPMPTGPTTAG